MKKSEFYVLIDELLGLPPGTITGNEQISRFPNWDSLAILGFIALLDEHFDLIVPAVRIMECQSIADLVQLVEGKLK